MSPPACKAAILLYFSSIKQIAGSLRKAIIYTEILIKHYIVFSAIICFLNTMYLHLTTVFTKKRARARAHTHTHTHTHTATRHQRQQQHKLHDKTCNCIL